MKTLQQSLWVYWDVLKTRLKAKKIKKKFLSQRKSSSFKTNTNNTSASSMPTKIKASVNIQNSFGSLIIVEVKSIHFHKSQHQREYPWCMYAGKKGAGVWLNQELEKSKQKLDKEPHERALIMITSFQDLLIKNKSIGIHYQNIPEGINNWPEGNLSKYIVRKDKRCVLCSESELLVPKANAISEEQDAISCFG